MIVAAPAPSRATFIGDGVVISGPMIKRQLIASARIGIAGANYPQRHLIKTRRQIGHGERRRGAVCARVDRDFLFDLKTIVGQKHRCSRAIEMVAVEVDHAAHRCPGSRLLGTTL